jgi:phosphatidylserine decarboxylase
VENLKNLVESTPQLFMYFNLMFEQVTPKERYDSLPVKNFQDLLIVLDHIMQEPPEFNTTGLVGFPINAILNWPMATEAGFAAFNDPRVNQAIERILCDWGKFLASPASCKYLTDESPRGWFCEEARREMGDFERTFVCDPGQPHWGFTSWDDFFTRRLRPGARPVEDAEDGLVVGNACESSPFAIAHGLAETSTFWAKGQPYSLSHIFQGDPVHREFVGGTLFQAFLSALCYHRWHSPVAGTVLRCWRVAGTYYSEAPGVQDDDCAPNASQRYLSEVATRAIILLQADEPAIGLMAFVAVGMAEVSSCEITVRPGQVVRKGDQLGSFHFGGSTHLLLFRPHTAVSFDFLGPEHSPGLHAAVLPINARLARVRKSEP